MSNQTDYASKLDAANAIPEDQVQTPYIPVGIYLQEAEDLYHWSMQDKDKLVAASLPAVKIKNLPTYTGACRIAQSMWMKDQQQRKDSEDEWKEEAPKAFDLRDRLVHALDFAYRDDSDLSRRVDAIREGAGNADMIQDLSDIAVLGKANPGPLKKINFDLKLLDKAEELSDTLGDLLGRVNGDRLSTNESKIIRDRMYTLLKQNVDEIRDCGKFVFWRNDDRLRGYSSNYMRRNRGKSKKVKEQEELM